MGLFMEAILGTAGDVIDALGGTVKAAEKLGRPPQAVSNWRAAKRIPSTLFLSINAALEAAGKPQADPAVFGMAVPNGDQQKIEAN